MAVSGSIKATMNFAQTATGGLATASSSLNESISLSFADGTAANQANVLWSDSRTLTATSEDLDLAGVLASVYGVTVALARVKGLYIKNTHATASLTIGGASSNAWATLFGDATDKLVIPPGGFVLLAAPLATGYTVTAGTGDKLKIDSGASTIIYRIALLGCNA